MSVAQFENSPRRSYYSGRDMERALSIADLRARAHKVMPRLALEYLEGGAEDESTLARERLAFDQWCFMPHTLHDEHDRSTEHPILGRTAAMPLMIAPTGLNGLLRPGGDLMLARAAARSGVPFIQSTMSNVMLETVAAVPGLRHWWQLYVFGRDEIWHSLVDRAAEAGCEALVLTTNAQIFGRREWADRLQITPSVPTISTALDAALHPRWLGRFLRGGMPKFENVTRFIPREFHGLFESAGWIRREMPKSLDWKILGKLRNRWRGPLLLKGVLNFEDVRRARDSGIDGLILGSHGGRQMDGAISALDILARTRGILGPDMPLYVSSGIRRGTDIIKALALGADAVLVGRAPLYGLCAGGEPGVARALAILRAEIRNAIGQLGIARMCDLDSSILVAERDLPLA